MEATFYVLDALTGIPLRSSNTLTDLDDGRRPLLVLSRNDYYLASHSLDGFSKEQPSNWQIHYSDISGVPSPWRQQVKGNDQLNDFKGEVEGEIISDRQLESSAIIAKDISVYSSFSGIVYARDGSGDILWMRQFDFPVTTILRVNTGSADPIGQWDASFELQPIPILPDKDLLVEGQDAFNIGALEDGSLFVLPQDRFPLFTKGDPTDLRDVLGKLRLIERGIQGSGLPWIRQPLLLESHQPAILGLPPAAPEEMAFWKHLGILSTSLLIGLLGLLVVLWVFKRRKGLKVPTKTNEKDETTRSFTVSDRILGYGSHGTVVFQGTFDGREVAVKRLLLDF